MDINELKKEIAENEKNETLIPTKKEVVKETEPTTFELLKASSLKMLNNAIKESQDLSELVINGSTELARTIALTLSRRFK